MLFLILLLEGFITISVEIITIRQLTPFFGNSIVITSVIIGVFLLFLALGYWRGGSHNNHFFKALSKNFIFSLFWIGVGLNYTFIYLFLNKLSQYNTPTLCTLALYLLFILAPIVYWLGQTIPLTTNLFNQQHRASRISGYALFISTAGSFLGALITSLLLFQWVGVAWAIVINCGLLLILIVQLRTHSALRWWHIGILFYGLYCIKYMNIDIGKAQFIKTNSYANYRVLTPTPEAKILEINASFSSMLTTKQRSFAYIEYIQNLLFNQLKLSDKTILVIGAGGFTLSAQGEHGNHITYLDIDPDIKTIAEKHFLNTGIKGQFIGQDARAFLNHSSKSYDVIISDVYSHQLAIPPQLLTVDYFQKLASHLSVDGLLIVNLIASPLFNDAFSQRADNTIRQVFKFCTVTPISWETKVANMIYVCRNQKEEQKVYTDNLTTATLDFFAMK